ncbi:MAG: hypothetical protein WCQ67_01985 [Treponema sp.]
MDEEKDTFNKELLEAIKDRINFFDTNVLVNTQENYRLHHSCVKNIFDVLTNKSLVNPDPYKNEKKISDIVSPENTEFSDNERPVILGTRFSDYESMLDFICNYFKFSVEHITLEQIRKLNDLNSTFAWNNLSLNSQKPNTRALATVLVSARNGADPLTLSLINDSISKSAKALQEITSDFKALSEFQREVYKGNVRTAVFDNSQFNKEKAYRSPADMQLEIKKLFPVVMDKKPYYSDLIGEIVLEELGKDKEQRREKLLSNLRVVKKVATKKEVVVDTHEMIMDCVRVIGTMSDQYNLILDKICANHELLESENNSFSDKLIKFIRKTFGLKDPPLDYEVLITDKATETTRRLRISYDQFVADLSKRVKYYASFSIKRTPGYNKIATMTEDKIIDFINTQMAEIHELENKLDALDRFFKDACSTEDHYKVKGIKMELTTLKNIQVKANQRRAEYLAYVEEKEQMKKLGITE